MASTLVIGVGGTGLKTVILLKKQLVDQSPRGELPEEVKLLVLDTETEIESIRGIGGKETSRVTSAGYDGLVALNRNSEYHYVGGDAYEWIVGNQDLFIKGWDRKHYARSWFNDEFFKNHPLAQQILNIHKGASQYRQVGRLAIFLASRNGAESEFYGMIQNRLDALPGDNIKVIVCGSLAGGTGAAMFMDIAHLTKKIARISGKRADVYGLLALPTAFENTPPVDVNDAMKARATAALRELRRFLTVSQDDLGFEMRYVSGDDRVLRARTVGAVFSVVYLFDQRWKPRQKTVTPNPLNVRIEHGVCPTMAAWIAALVDSDAGDKFESGLVNRAQLLSNRSVAGAIPAVAGSTGSYSYVLPVAAIAEEWTARLSGEVVDVLIPVKVGDNKTSYADPKMKGGKPSVSGSEQAEKDWAAPGMIPAGKDIYHWGSSYQKDNDSEILIGNLEKRTLDDWKLVLQYIPKWLDESPEQEDRATAAKERSTYENMPKTFFYNRAATGIFADPFKGALIQKEPSKTHGGDVKVAADALKGRSKTVLGNLRQLWEEMLKTNVLRQVEYYQQDLLKFTLEELNGDGQTTPLNARLNRAGRPGWLLDYLRKRVEHLSNTQALFKIAIRNRERQIIELEDQLNTTHLNAMRGSENRQKDYLSKYQDLLDHTRWLVQAKAESDLVAELLAYTQSLLAQLDAFISILQTGQVSTRKSLESHRKTVRGNRGNAFELHLVRNMIDDEAWEDKRYQGYISRQQTNLAQGTTAVDRALADLAWNIKQVPVDLTQPKGTKTPQLSLEIGGFPRENQGILSKGDIIAPISTLSPEANDKLVESANANLLRLMARSKVEFSGIWDELTILDYLYDTWSDQTQNKTAEAFAKTLLDQCEVVLRIPDTVVKPYRLAYLLAPQPRSSTAQGTWLAKVLNELINKAAADANNSGIMYNQDTTSLTYLAVADLIDIDKLDAYREGMREYLRWPPTSVGIENSRALNHLFPAEQHAVRFDKQDGVLVPTRTTAVLEDEESLKRYIQAEALGMIEQKVYSEESNPIGKYEHILIPPRADDLDKAGDPITRPWDYWLNEPRDFVTDDVPYLIAAETFCLRNEDLSKGRDEHPNQKPTGDMRERFKEAIDAEIKKRLKDEFLPQWEKGQGLPAGIAAAALPAGRDKDDKLMSAMRTLLYKEQVKILEAYQKELARKGETQDETRSVFKMVLQDEISFNEVMIKYCQTWIQLGG